MNRDELNEYRYAIQSYFSPSRIILIVVSSVLGSLIGILYAQILIQSREIEQLKSELIEERKQVQQSNPEFQQPEH